MNIVKSLHASLLHKCFSFQQKHYFTVSILWGFNLQTGEPVIEQDMWKTIGDLLGKNELFDAGYPKPNAEVLVHGSCFAAAGEAVNANRVSVKFDDISKELYVYGDRHWIKGMGIGWGVSDPLPFTEMPVSYHNAFGGKDYAANPLGKGIDEIDLNGEAVIPLPNIEYPQKLISAPGDRPVPASFNRIDFMCEQRMLNAGTYDQKYIETRMPGYPDDLDYRYFNDAAKDQWSAEYFNGDESYEVRNMNPHHAVMKGKLPGVYGRAFVNQSINDNIEFKEIPTQLDTVWMLPADELGIMIYRGTLEVSEDDAADIRQLLIANENSIDTPRELSHYQNELALRTDPEESFKYLLYTAPLIPTDCTCGFKIMQENAGLPLEMIASSNMENYAENKKKEAEESLNQQMESIKKQLEDSGLSADEVDDMMKKFTDSKDQPGELNDEAQQMAAIMEKVLPGAQADPKNLDLSKLNLKAMDELKVLTDKIQKEKKQEAKEQLVKQAEELKKIDAGAASEQSIASLEKAIVEFDLPPRLPRMNVDDILSQLKVQNDDMEKQLLQLQSMGVPEADLVKMKASFNIEVIAKQTEEGLEQAKDGYRVGAHHIEQSRSPHEGEEDAIRESLIKAYNSGAKTAQGDYAFIDLSNLDLAGINLSGAYLEYANLSNTNLTDANLTKAILSHAIVNNTNFTNANLVEANLGAIDFEGGQFVNADLTNAMLGKSHIKETLFQQCKMAEKMDMFLETTFDKAQFIDSDLHQSNFIDADISGSDFSGSDLTGSNFLNPVMKGVKFSRADLSGVNFVTAQGDFSKFDHAVMKNVRFVAESSLQNADFQFADVSESNLRDCQLQQANFSESTLFKTDFSGANLKNADLNKAKAVQAQFVSANLTHAHLQRVDMMEASFFKAILSGAEFNNANLYGANFMGCTVGDTDFSGAYLVQTLLKDWRP